jgi:glucans biosynthesis protein C
MNKVAGNAGRLYYLDWIRVLAMVGIFFFHNCRFYDSFSDWHVKNALTNPAASWTVAFLSMWIMPLFFLIAGAGSYLAFRSRSAGQFLKERTLRLLIPLIFGMLVIVVPQAYFQAVSHGTDLSGLNLFEIYWLYLQSLPDMNTFHLWFLIDLFIFSVITIPLFYGFGKTRLSLMARLAAFFEKPWVLVLALVLAIAVVNIGVYPDGYWGNRNGGWNIVTYLLFFITGYLIFANPRIMESIRRLRWPALGAGVVALAGIGFGLLAALADPVAYYGSARFILAGLAQSICVWGWLLAILGFGSTWLNKTNRGLEYANEAVLPFYILHQTVIISIGFYVVQWNTGIGLKYLVISISSFITIMLIYELLVRRISGLRFLFGMKPKRKPGVEPAPDSAARLN